jgi:hypothetical protein
VQKFSDPQIHKHSIQTNEADENAETLLGSGLATGNPGRNRQMLAV